MTINVEYPNSFDKRGTAEVKTVTAVKSINSGLNSILEEENKVDLSKIQGRGIPSSSIKPMWGQGGFRFASAGSPVNYRLTETATIIPKCSSSFTLPEGPGFIVMIHAVWNFQHWFLSEAHGYINFDGATLQGSGTVTSRFKTFRQVGSNIFNSGQDTVRQVIRIEAEGGKEHTIDMMAYYHSWNELSPGIETVSYAEYHTNHYYVVFAKDE